MRSAWSMRRPATLLARRRNDSRLANTFSRIRRGGGHVDSNATHSTASKHFRHRVYLAVGSNLGDRFQNIATALTLLCDDDYETSSYQPTKMTKTSFLHVTAPMYVTDQPAFLNGAVEVYTDLEPDVLLRRIKLVERDLGRNFSQVRNGPRPVDVDILFCDSCFQHTHQNDDNDTMVPLVVDTPNLTIPHPLLHEREFVLAPLSEVADKHYKHPILQESIGGLLDTLRDTATSSITEEEEEEPTAIRVIPLPRGRLLSFHETIIMGILNVTPDSFSDGGEWNSSVELSVQRALEMEQEGAAIIDIGGESTRPGAQEIAIEEQLRRTIPVIEGIRQASDVAISIDTRHAAVAKAAIQAGADIVNDVSGGTFDPAMLPTVSKLGVPIILMHMRGTPETMQSMTGYENVVQEVAAALQDRVHEAEAAGISRWLQIVDPGIGFAKDMEGNLSLLKNLGRLRELLGDMPILLGTSRKGFLGKLTGETEDARYRDFGTVASCVAALCLDHHSYQSARCDILRVHNVKAAKDAASVMDAIRGARR